MNEGYDTDNDGISDKAELVDSRNKVGDPQDHDDPYRRQALWFDGAQSAARTLNAYSFGEWAFRSFTIELWARPEAVVRATKQVMLERAVTYVPSDNSTNTLVVRKNFSIGIEANTGRLYAMFDNAGTHDEHTANVYAFGPVLTPSNWVHVVARMDGSGKAFSLFVNGELRANVQTALIPANGVVDVQIIPNISLPVGVTVTPAILMLGAESIAVRTWADYSNFYQGWIDEVRVWDGARTDDEIASDYKKRYTKDMLLANRDSVQLAQYYGGSRVANNPTPLPPELLYYFTFDNLFSADRTSSVATAPRGFNHADVVINRPAAPLAAVGFWDGMLTKSAVYTDYNVVPWIENGMDHLPLFGGFKREGSNFVVVAKDRVRNSVFWSHTHSGNLAVTNNGVSSLNDFPNSNDPYGDRYVTYDVPVLAGRAVAGDLLPLGNAWAKQSETMWDNNGASGAWLETGVDGDSDGLPTWWEDEMITNRFLLHVPPLTYATISWNDPYPDNSGRTYGEQYQRDVAKGVSQNNLAGGGPFAQTADTDGDGMPDWWESLYNLNSFDASGEDGAGGDPDRDGLSNLAEYLISDKFNIANVSPRKLTSGATQAVSDYFIKVGKMTLGAMFTDHDSMVDSWEDLYNVDSVNRYVYDRHLDPDQDGWDNWSESLYGLSNFRSDPTLGMHWNTAVDLIKDFPVPLIKTTLSYRGLRPVGNTTVIFAYSTPGMDGMPDAVFQYPADGATASTPKSKYLGFWAAKTLDGTLSPGSIEPGSLNLQFTDLAPDPTANAAGISWPLASRQMVAGTDNIQPNTEGKIGVIKARNFTGLEIEIGTINYATGHYSIDFSKIDGWVIRTRSYDPNGRLILPALSVNNAFIKINYNNKQVAVWPRKLYMTDAEPPNGSATCPVLSQGYIRQGLNYFFAFCDVNANFTWDAGEPCGVSTPLAVDIGWQSNELNIEMTDYTPGYLRMTLQPGARSEDVVFGTSGQQAGNAGGAAAAGTTGLERRIRVRRTIVDSSSNYNLIVLDKMLTTRNYLHEGDFLGMGSLGLDWGLPQVETTMNRTLVVYDVYEGDKSLYTNNTLILTFTNRFDSAQATAKGSSPASGMYVYSSRPVFKWTMPAGYTAFALELRKGSANGPLVYQSGEQQAPRLDVETGEYVWEAPIHAGDKLMSGHIFTSNTLYFWRVTALNPKYTLATTVGSINWSDWKVFRLDVNSFPMSGGYGDLKAVVKYFGPATNLLSGRVKVQVFNNCGFSGVPVAQVTMTDESLASLTSDTYMGTNAVLRGLEPSSTTDTKYYVRAYIDYNQNGVCDVWESSGYANYYGVKDLMFDVKPFTVELSKVNETATVYIEDADTDQDWFPDGWEYELNPASADFLALTGPVTSPVDYAEVNTNLQALVSFGNLPAIISLAPRMTDADGDGLSDMVELLLGTDASKASSANDGYRDGDKVELGLSPNDLLLLGVTGLGLDVSGANVQWKLDVKRAALTDRTFLSTLTGVPDATSVGYVIEYKQSLSDTVWVPVETGSVPLKGLQTHLGQIKPREIDPAKGFFRVRLTP
jgi:hypothetical protein